MKISNKLIVLREKKRGYFMENIENNPHSLATKAGFVGEIRGALSLPYEYYLKQKSFIIKLFCLKQITLRQRLQNTII